MDENKTAEQQTEKNVHKCSEDIISSHHKEVAAAYSHTHAKYSADKHHNTEKYGQRHITLERIEYQHNTCGNRKYAAHKIQPPVLDDPACLSGKL